MREALRRFVTAKCEQYAWDPFSDEAHERKAAFWRFLYRLLSPWWGEEECP